MKILLSPAKSLDYDRTIKTSEVTNAPYIQNADYLAGKLGKISKNKLGELMHLSEQLTDLNYDRYQSWQKPEKAGNKIKCKKKK
jgi:cytoplasmic iron level regulating protein YaaA (DUF328/UPF0246 family)